MECFSTNINKSVENQLNEKHTLHSKFREEESPTPKFSVV